MLLLDLISPSRPLQFFNVDAGFIENGERVPHLFRKLHVSIHVSSIYIVYQLFRQLLDSESANRKSTFNNY